MKTARFSWLAIVVTIAFGLVALAARSAGNQYMVPPNTATTVWLALACLLCAATVGSYFMKGEHIVTPAFNVILTPSLGKAIIYGIGLQFLILAGNGVMLTYQGCAKEDVLYATVTGGVLTVLCNIANVLVGGLSVYFLSEHSLRKV